MKRISNFVGVAFAYALSLVASAYNFVTGYATNVLNYAQRLLPYTVDSAIKSLDGSASRLDRARTKAIAMSAAEDKLGEQLETAADAAYARADALQGDADRALRIRNRISDLLK